MVARDGNRATLVAQPAAAQRFLGWQISGANVARIGTAPAITTWANPLTLTLTAELTITPIFAAQQPFPDVAANDPANGALAELAARGIIRGYDSGAVGPDDPILRAQMAALIARTVGYTDQPGNPFTDRCDPQPARQLHRWRTLAGGGPTRHARDRPWLHRPCDLCARRRALLRPA